MKYSCVEVMFLERLGRLMVLIWFLNIGLFLGLMKLLVGSFIELLFSECDSVMLKLFS